MFKEKMKSSSSAIVVTLLLIPALLFAQKDYKDLKFPELQDVSIPQITERTLSNGLRLFLVENHDFPTISMSARVRTGSMYEPEDKIGLASMTGRVMRTGGTQTTSGDELDEFLESRAASVEVSIGLNAGSASLFCLKENLQEVLGIFADVLRNPVFPEEKIVLAKIQSRTAISRRNDSIGAIAGREFGKIIYGADNPYARTTEYETIENITRDDMVAFHEKFFHPNNIIMGVIGDFNTDEMVENIEKALKTWPRTAVNIPPKPTIDYEFKPGVFLVDKKDAVQTNLILGHIGGTRDNPDYFAITVMNSILGGGFTSRLFSRVRTQEGLAYSVGGSYGSNYDYPGMFRASCQTKTETTVRAARSILEEIERLTNDLVTDEELNLAIDGFLNRFVFNFDSKAEVLNRLITYKYFDYPDDFIMQIKDNIEKVTANDVLRVAKKYLRYDKVQLIFVGNSEAFDEPVSVFGDVTQIDITIPDP
jgi:zinc protease